MIAWLRVITLTLVVFALTVACKPKLGSETKSLDNFGAGKDLHRNQCRAPQADFAERYAVAQTVPVSTGGTLPEKESEDVIKAVHEALTALPSPLIRAFKAGGGRFVLDPAAKANCSQMAKTIAIASPNDTESCQYYLQQARTGFLEVLVVMPPEKALIQHNVVKSVGYSLSQIMAHLRVKKGVKGFVLDSGKNAAIDTMGKQLMRAFMMDVGTFAHKGMFESLAVRYFNVEDMRGLGEFIAKNKPAEVIAGETSKDLLDFFQFKSEAKRIDMQDWLFAHTLDSAYCDRTAAYDRKVAFDAMFDGENLSASERDAALKNTYAVMKDYFPFAAETHRRWEKELFKFARFLELKNPASVGLRLADATPNPAAVEGEIDAMMESPEGRRFLEANPSYNRMIGTEQNPGARRMIQANSDDIFTNTYGTSVLWNDGEKQVKEDAQMAAYPAWAGQQVDQWHQNQDRLAGENRARADQARVEGQKQQDTQRAVNDPAFYRDTYIPTYSSRIAELNNSSTQQQGGMSGQSSGYTVGANAGAGQTGASGGVSGGYSSSQASGSNWASGQQQAGVGVNAATYEQNAYRDWYNWRKDWAPASGTTLDPRFPPPASDGQGISSGTGVAGPNVSMPTVSTGTAPTTQAWAPPPVKTGSSGGGSPGTQSATAAAPTNPAPAPAATVSPSVAAPEPAAPVGGGGVVTASNPEPVPDTGPAGAF